MFIVSILINYSAENYTGTLMKFEQPKISDKINSILFIVERMVIVNT
jgi:hypothetical protein